MIVLTVFFRLLASSEHGSETLSKCELSQFGYDPGIELKLVGEE
jgi:hypothetical protein